MRIQTKQTIDVWDWDETVTKTYGKPYSFQQQDGCRNRGVHTLHVSLAREPYDFEATAVPEVINGNEMGVSFASWLARNPAEWNGKEEDRRFLNLFWERNFYPAVEAVAYDLCKKGLLPEGDYLINIDW